MKKRPLSIIIIALIYLLQPVGNLLVAAYVHKQPVIGPGGIVNHLIWSDWLILLLFPVVAFGIWKVRKWGWYLFMAFSALLIGYNIYVHLYLNPNYSTKMVVGFIVGITIVVALFLRKHVYSPYFNPRMRWWEVAERFRVQLDIQIKTSDQGAFTCPTVDISQSGCFVRHDKMIEEGERVWLEIPFGPRKISLLGKIVRRAHHEGLVAGYGILFEAMTADTRWHIHQLVNALKQKGIADRQGVPAVCDGSDFASADSPPAMTIWWLKIKALFT